MKHKEENIEKFERFEKVRLSGKFNMITECAKAAASAKLSMEEYIDIVKNYEKYREENKEK